MSEKTRIDLFKEKLVEICFSKGWSFVPVKEKKPLASWKDFQKRKPTKEEIKKWSNFNRIGVICGKISGKNNSLEVIDIDAPQYFEFFKDIKTRVHRTPNGGYHLLFYSKTENTRKPKYRGFHIDLLGKGGYFIFGEGYKVEKDYPILEIEDTKKLLEERLPKLDESQYPEKNLDFKRKIENFKNHINIEDILSHYGATNIKRIGHCTVCRCPFDEGEHEYNSIINQDSYFCFSENKLRDVVAIVQEKEKCDFWGAIKKLEEISNIKFERENKSTTREIKDIKINKTISQEDFEKEERKGELRLKINLSDENFITKYVKIFSQRTDAPIDYLCCCAISIISTLINRKIKCSLAQEVIYPNCWFFLVGESTTARKSVVIRFAENLLRDVGYNTFLPTDFTPEALIEFLADNSRCLFCFDEGAGFLTRLNKKTYNADLKYILCRLFDNTDYRRKLRTRRGENTDFRVESPYLNQLIGIQPQSLARHSNEEDFESGFCLRFLYSYPTYPRKLKPLFLLTEKDKENYEYLVEEAKKIKEFIDEIEEEKEIEWKEGAFTYFIKWSTSLQEESLKTKNSEFKNAIGRLIPYAIKLAIVFAVAEKKETIDINIIKESCRIITFYFLPMHLRVFNLIKYDIEKNLQERIINFLERNGGSATYRTVAQYLHCKYADLLDSIDYLQNISREIEVIEIASGNKKKKIIRLISDNNKYNNLLKSVEKGVSTKIPENSGENRRILANQDSVELLKSVEICTDKDKKEDRIKYSTNFNNSTTNTNSSIFSAKTTSKPQNSPFSDSATKFNKFQQIKPKISFAQDIISFARLFFSGWKKQFPEEYNSFGISEKNILKYWSTYYENPREVIKTLSEKGVIFEFKPNIWKLSEEYD